MLVVLGGIRLAIAVAILQVQPDGLEQRVAMDGQLEGVAGVVAGDAAGKSVRIVEVVAVVKALLAGRQHGEELRRVIVISPVQQQTVARHPTVEPAREHLERTDQHEVERVGERVKWIERGQPADELPEAEEVVGEREPVLGPQPGAALLQPARHDDTSPRRKSGTAGAAPPHCSGVRRCGWSAPQTEPGDLVSRR
ncbi:MAG: hypothetical protein U0736_13320 [Gemmataceae bacterium]